MNAQKIVEEIEKLIDEKFKIAAILSAKGLGESKELFLHEARQKLDGVKVDLIRALAPPE